MKKPASMLEISQADINTLLAQLQQLRQEITTARSTLAPLEANLAETFNEFQAVVGALRRHSMRLGAEIASIRIQIESFTHQEDNAQQFDESDDNSFDTKEEIIESTQKDPEAIDKDMLLEHIYRVLDPDVNDEDACLVGYLQGLCNDTSASLADVLEELPWGIVWTTKNPQENLAQQFERLRSWEVALNRQLQNLKLSTERLHKDPRYPLWQQQQKGQEHWRHFLNQCIEQQQDQNDELQAELAKLKQEWEQIFSVDKL